MPREMRKLFQYQSAGEPIPGSSAPAIHGGNKNISKLPEAHRSERRRTWDNITKGELAETLGNISHELRTPLAAMKVTLKVVLDGETGPVNSDQVRFLGMTMRNIDRLDRLIGDLLDVSRAEVGRLALKREMTDLGPLLREAVEMLMATARHRGISLDYTGLPDSFPAHVDVQRLA